MRSSAFLKYLPSVGIVFLASILALLLFVYEKRHESQLLEGNKLYSSQAVLVDAEPSLLIKNLSELGQDARAYLLLSDQANIRIVVANDYEQLRFPLNHGKGFSSEKPREALVGADVDTVIDGSKEYYVFNDDLFEVVGVLGTKPDSMLQREVLIKDVMMFDEMDSSAVVLDGKSAKERVNSLLPEVSTERFDFGASRRTSIDTVSPILFGVGGILVAAGYLCAGLLFGYRMKAKNAVLVLLGASSRRIYVVQSLLLLGLVAGVLVSSIFVVALVVSDYSTSAGEWLVVGLAAIVLTVSASLIAPLTDKKV